MLGGGVNVHVYRPHLYYYTDYSDLSFGTTEVSSLRDRRRELCESLFRQIVRNESHVLHYLLTAKRDSLLLTDCDQQRQFRTTR